MSLRWLRLFFVLLTVKNSLEWSFVCEFKIGNFSVIGDVYTCHSKKILGDLDDTKTHSINGKHMTGKSDKDVEGLKINVESKIIKYFPSNLLSTFPNLKAIWIWQSDISEISSDRLQSYTDLEYIYIGQSRLSSIPGDLFKFNTKLKFVEFKKNRHLNYIGENFLENLKSLQAVSFDANKCINYKAETPETIRYLKDELLSECPNDIPYLKEQLRLYNHKQSENQEKLHIQKNLTDNIQEELNIARKAIDEYQNENRLNISDHQEIIDLKKKLENQETKQKGLDDTLKNAADVFRKAFEDLKKLYEVKINVSQSECGRKLENQQNKIDDIEKVIENIKTQIQTIHKSQEKQITNNGNSKIDVDKQAENTEYSDNQKEANISKATDNQNQNNHKQQEVTENSNNPERKSESSPEKTTNDVHW
jgi:hypothetical protein